MASFNVSILFETPPAIKVGYEGAKTSYRKKDEILKAFNIGIGYRF